MLRGQHSEQQVELLELRGALASERERSEELQAQLDTFAAERAEMEALRRRVPELEQDAAAARDMTAVERTRSVELGDSCRTLKSQLERLTRTQAELLDRCKRADEATKRLQADKETIETAMKQAKAKVAVQERQLVTFLSANEAIEADLQQQMAAVAALERRAQEQEAERATIEAYYSARLTEAQAQFDRLLEGKEGRHPPRESDIPPRDADGGSRVGARTSPPRAHSGGDAHTRRGLHDDHE
mmetsp:Transcript_19951/g.58703  ORF Transcript_19951/g.58703 Transcript_19951/m.58703 type:complete len:244 (+) Transcript_19951:377-1108(+)